MVSLFRRIYSGILKRVSLATILVFLVSFRYSGKGESSAPDLSAVSFRPGATVEVSWPPLEDPLLIWLPRNYSADAEGSGHPLALWYHGTNGKPVLDPLWTHSEGKDWIIVGMTYRESGTFRGEPENIAAELRINQAVRQALSEVLKIDRRREFVGGFSKGGWVSALLLQSDPTLAGGWIMGGGVMDEKPGFVRPGRSVYVGIGEVDPNRAMSERAVRAFRDPTTRVTLDEWPELGHRLPEDSECLAQWLNVEGRLGGASSPTEGPGGIAPLTGMALDWFDSEMAAIRRSGEPVADRYFALQRLATFPLFAYLDEESRQAHGKREKALAVDPAMDAERQAETIYRKILEVESRDRLLGTLVICHEDYRRLAESHPETHYGKAAARAVERTRGLIPGE